MENAPTSHLPPKTSKRHIAKEVLKATLVGLVNLAGMFMTIVFLFFALISFSFAGTTSTSLTERPMGGPSTLMYIGWSLLTATIPLLIAAWAYKEARKTLLFTAAGAGTVVVLINAWIIFS